METSLLGLLIWCFYLKLLQAAEIFQQQQQPAPPKTRTPKTKEWIPSSSSFLVSAFTWVPTLNLDKAEPEGSEAAMAFLYSGDTLSLSQANCTQRFEMRALVKDSRPPPALYSYLRSATDTLTHATNFLNMVFQTNDIRESSVKEDVEWYHALVRSVIEGDSQVYRAILTFDAHPLSSKPQLILQATKGNNEILLQDLSAFSENLRNLTWENEWYNFFRFQRTPPLYKRILSNDLKTLDTPKWSQGDSYVMDQGYIKWSPPFLECEDGKFLPTWMVTLSSSFYGLKPDLNPEFKGVMRLDVKIQNVDINQCATNGGWFANSHQCDLNSTQCIPQENHGFILGKYSCLCKPGFYGGQRTATSHLSSISKGWSGQSASQDGAVNSGNLLQCHPCWEGCMACIDGKPCLIQEDWSLRAIVLAFQAFCMLTVFFNMLISYHYRKSKRIRASGVILLETILFGSLLLYFPVFILYFKPSIFRCIVLRWVRMLGFAIVYGTITLKLYRVLKVFLSHTAQRVPYMTSGLVLKKLALILLLVLWFLAAWTVGMLENIEKNIPLVVRSQTPRGLQFYICDQDRWDYMMAVAEMLFLFWGSFLCFTSRTIPSAFHEPRYMCIAVHNELITSTAFHVMRFLMVPSLHPDWTLLLFFIHTHVTTTMTLALIFIPKFLYAGSPLREEIAAEMYEDELDIRHSGSFLNSSITSAWSEHSLDPDDIRDELKKLYTQLEFHKTKKMTANNPHLQKKRSSKRGLGHTLMRRITELPESMSRQCSKKEKDGSISGRRQNHSVSYKQRFSDSRNLSMKLKEDLSPKHKVAFQAQGGISLQKSHSTYDHQRDVKANSELTRHDSCKEAPLLDSLMRKKLVKKTSEKSDNDSVYSATLVYKSASAHNLLADKKSLHPKYYTLQKSLSVASSEKENASLLTRTANLENTHKLAQEKDISAVVEDTMPESEKSRHTEFSNVISEIEVKPLQRENTAKGIERHFPEGKNVICPWEAETDTSTPLESRDKKDVTPAPIRSISINISDLPERRPHTIKKIPPEPPIRQQSLIHNLERCVAQWDTYDQKQHPAQSPKKEPPNIPVPVNIYLTETEEGSSLKPEMEKTMQEENKVPSSSPVELTRLASIAAEVCPWEVMEMPIPSKKDLEVSDSDNQNSSPEKQSQTLIPKSSIKSLGMAIKASNHSKLKGSISSRKNSESSEAKNEKDISGKSKLAETDLIPAEGSSRQEVPSRSPGYRRAKPFSKQATICPWDEEEEASPSSQKNNLNNLNRNLELCPWEMNEDIEDRVSNLPATVSKGAKEISPNRLEKTKSQWGSMCPSGRPEDQNRENKTSDLLSLVSKTDKKAEICPWEISEPKLKIEVSPWENNDPSTSERELKGNVTVISRDEKKGTREEAFVKGNNKNRESICPWENIVSEDLLIKSTSKTISLSKLTSENSETLENRNTTVCPWEAEGTETANKAEICPWEMLGPFNQDTERATKKTVAIESKSPEKACSSQETRNLCEILNTDKLSSESNVKGLNSSRSGSAENLLYAEVCPWESMDSPKIILQKETSPYKSLKKVSNLQEAVCPWDNVDPSISSKIPSKNFDSTENLKAEVCPWEATKENASKADEGCKNTSPVSLSKSTANLSNLQEDVCPWDSREIQQFSPRSGDQRLAPYNSGLKKFDNIKSLSIDVCPWETSEEVKISPWTEAMRSLKTKKQVSTVLCKEKEGSALKIPSSNKAWKEVAFKKVKISRSNQGSTFPSGSVITDEPTRKNSQSPHLLQVSSKNTGSVESVKAEICPWDFQELQTDAKIEGPPDESTFRKESDQISNYKADTKPLIRQIKRQEEVSSPQESICPWESMAQISSQSPTLPKDGSTKSENAERAEICPWEVEEEESSGKTELCLMETEPTSNSNTIVNQDISGVSKCNMLTSPSLKKVWRDMSAKVFKSHSQQASISSQKNIDIISLTPSSKSLDLSIKPNNTKSLKTEIWEMQEAGATMKAEICPWEVTEAPLEKGTTRKAFKENVKTDSRSSVETPEALEESSNSLQSDLNAAAVTAAVTSTSLKMLDGTENMEISLQEAKQSKTFSKREICPWEAEAEVPANTGEITQIVQQCLAGPMSLGHSLSRAQSEGTKKILSSESREDIFIDNTFSSEAEKDSTLTRTDSAKNEKGSEACLGETEEVSSVPAVVTQSKTEQKPDAQEAEDPSKITSSICPWDYN
ncbi:probable G-protein coupled receptor 179 [Pantherophis guttatus]|uniref:Probable G-protein coupled receptor 179 n=1 Tax=Pantherophis guttatus TaxID=94885 RepID=A0A6P9BNA7_PANGU|nr:probable G-protein coupled receptor 179 [Pantherophis guttatus]